MHDLIKIEDFYEFQFLQGVEISQSGKIAYVLASYKRKNENKGTEENTELDENGKAGNLVAKNYEEVSHIWVIDGENHFQLTTTGKEQAPSWSPNSSKIVYSSKKEEQPQLYLLNLKGGEPRQLTSFENGVGGKVSWVSESKILFCSAKNEKFSETTDPYLVSRDFFRMDAIGLVERTLFDVYMLDLETDELTQLTETGSHHIGIELSLDKSHAIISSMFLEDDIIGIFTRPFLLSIESKELVQLSELSATGISWIDNDTITFAGYDIHAKIGSNSHLFTLNVKTRELVNLTENDFYGTTGGFQADMPTVGARLPKTVVYKNNIYYNVQIRGNYEIRRFNLETNSIESILQENSNFLIDIVEDQIYFTKSSFHNPLDIFTYDLGSKTEKQLTHTNEKFLNTKRLPEVKNLKFNGADGEEVEGWLYIPTNNTSQPYPMLLNIHGGPHAGWGDCFGFENLYLLSKGYAILQVNQRGSTGYGEKFSSMIVGDWGNHDYLDLMAGVDFVIGLGYVDPEKLGCFGISGGGNLSTWIIGQTNRFKAAIPENPVTNWNSFFGVSDVGRWFAKAEMGGLPWEIPEIYRNSSPITYAHKCTTPTLMIQHEGDLRCPTEQSDQYYNVLKEVGCTVEMLRMPNTPHAGSLIGPLVIREKQNRAILEWFQRFID